jgi:hypothetical protein
LWSVELLTSFAADACMACISMPLITSGAMLQRLVDWLLDFNWDSAIANGAWVYFSEAF